MVLPDGSGRDARRPTPFRGILAGAGASALLVGVVLIGTVTAPGSTTTTASDRSPIEPVDQATFRVSDIATGPQPSWRHTMTVAESTPRTLVVHRGTVYLFSSPGSSGDDSGPISAMASGDGVEWVDLGQVLEGRAGPIVSTPDGLLAAEGREGGFDVLTSQDGTRWERSWVAAEEVPDGFSVNPTAAAGSEGQMAVGGHVDIDIGALLDEALQELGIDHTGELGWGVDTAQGTAEARVQIWGPLGLVAEEIDLDDLGLSHQQKAWLVGEFERWTRAPVWYFHEELGWQESIVEGAQWVGDVWFDGPRLVAQGWTQSGSAAEWSSFDGGATWELGDQSQAVPNRVESWPGGFVGVEDSGFAELAVHSNDGRWEQVGLRHFFPSEMQWYVSALDAGEAGVVLAAESWVYESEWTTRFDPVTRVDGATRLEIDLTSGRLVLTVGDETRTWSMYSQAEGIDIDFARELVTFSDRDDQKPLAEFSFEDLESAEREYWAQEPTPRTLQAFAFSRDLSNWSIQDVDAAFGEGRRISDLAVTGGHVVALVAESFPWTGDTPAGFEIWSAPLP